MLTNQDLCTWLRHNVEDLRLTPDLVTEAEGPTVRFRWHELATIGDHPFGLGVDLHPGLRLGEIWLYGPGARHVRLHGEDSLCIPRRIRAQMRCILLAHVSDPDHDWGRGHGLVVTPWRVDVAA